MPEFYTTQEVADRLGVSVFTIRRYIRAGKLRSVKLDGVYRVNRSDLAGFLSQREIGGLPGSTPPAEGEASERDDR